MKKEVLESCAPPSEDRRLHKGTGGWGAKREKNSSFVLVRTL